MAEASGWAGRSVAASVAASVPVSDAASAPASARCRPDTVIVTVTVFDQANPSETR